LAVPLYAPIGTPEVEPFLRTPDPALLAPMGTPEPVGFVLPPLWPPIGTPEPDFVAGPVGGLWVVDVGALFADPVFWGGLLTVPVGFLVAAAADFVAVPVAGLFVAGAGNAFGCAGAGKAFCCLGAGNALGWDGAGARYMGWLNAFLPPMTLVLRPRGLLAVAARTPGALV